ARAEDPRDDRQDWRGAPPEDSDAEAEQVSRRSHRREPADQPGTEARADHVRRTGRRRPAEIRVFHQRRDHLPLLLRTLLSQSVAVFFRLFRYADPGRGPPPGEKRRKLSVA